MTHSFPTRRSSDYCGMQVIEGTRLVVDDIGMKHLVPAPRPIDGTGGDVPIPDRVARGFDGEAQPFVAFLKRGFRRRAAHLLDRKSTRLNSSHYCASRMPSSARTKK